MIRLLPSTPPPQLSGMAFFSLFLFYLFIIIILFPLRKSHPASRTEIKRKGIARAHGPGPLAAPHLSGLGARLRFCTLVQSRHLGLRSEPSTGRHVSDTLYESCGRQGSDWGERKLWGGETTQIIGCSLQNKTAVRFCASLPQKRLWLQVGVLAAAGAAWVKMKQLAPCTSPSLRLIALG